MLDFPRSVGRPREFDLDEAIRNAMNVLWDHGYRRAALSDLLAAMEISKGSFYKAFGNKKTVFLRAVELYSDDAAQNVRKVLASDPSPKIALRNALLRFADISAGAEGKRGCFAVLVASETSPEDISSANLVQNHYDRLQAPFTEAVTEAQRAGEISAEFDPQRISHLIVTHAQGMRVLGKMGMSPEKMREGVDLLMTKFF